MDRGQHGAPRCGWGITYPTLRSGPIRPGDRTVTKGLVGIKKVLRRFRWPIKALQPITPAISGTSHPVRIPPITRIPLPPLSHRDRCLIAAFNIAAFNIAAISHPWRGYCTPLSISPPIYYVLQYTSLPFSLIARLRNPDTISEAAIRVIQTRKPGLSGAHKVSYGRPNFASVLTVCEMFGLDQRVSIEGIFCIVWNNIEFKMEPEWYYTSKELEQYMEIVTRKRWVTGEVGMKLEAFAIAGCDPVNMLRTAAQKVSWMKGEIHSILGKNLAPIHPSPAQ
ncbi:hypothetical protein B0H14DRAFT_2589497 [Mycena olivaceomarginata]|nr:hypothetical protein B0H14DRAFT_2589497 [Mycena olivaceomarginata]